MGSSENSDEAALFLAKFLLSVLETALSHLGTHLAYNAKAFYTTSLNASASSALLGHAHSTNAYRSLNTMQHLTSNMPMLVVHMCGGGGGNSCSSIRRMPVATKRQTGGCNELTARILHLFFLEERHTVTTDDKCSTAATAVIQQTVTRT